MSSAVNGHHPRCPADHELLSTSRSRPANPTGSSANLSTWANGQPAVGCYRRNDHDRDYHSWSVNVLRFRFDRIAEITSFLGADLFTLLGLPTALPGDDTRGAATARIASDDRHVNPSATNGT